jgi:hypothetical protein
MQFPTIADARFVYKAPIEPKDVDSIVDYLSVSEARIRPEIVGLVSSWSIGRGRTLGAQDKLKDGAMRLVWGHPHAAVMCLDN